MSTPYEESELSFCEWEAMLRRDIKDLRQRIGRMPESQRAECATTLFNIDLMEMELDMSRQLTVQQ